LATSTEWTDVDNWGGCATPICSRNAFVAPFTNQPILLTGQIYAAKDLIIQSGATLTLQANSTLEICGNLTNFGSISADPTSTIIFNGSAIQAISGNFTSNNRLGNLTVSKLSGGVILYNDLDLGGSFTTSSLTSIFNSNGKQLTLSKNFSNFSGNTTYDGTGTTGKLEFNGSGVQNYNQGLTQLNLNGVIISNNASIGSGVTLLSNMFIKATTGTLTLNQGTITTNSFAVNVLNTATNSVSTGSLISFVDGNLTRSLNATGSYEWPIGNVSKGYQRATTTFVTTNIGSLTGRFDNWPSGAGYPPIYGGSDCSISYGYGAQDNGYWTLTANSGTSANYDLRLYPIGATNSAGTLSWTIVKKTSLAAGAWAMDGTCAPSTANVVNRTGLSGFSIFGIAQSVTPLPIELLEFAGRSEGPSNYLEWTTATEINNDFFTLERSADGYDFQQIAVVDGAGNSSSLIHYENYDHNPFLGVTYYRFKQTDFNGLFSYSNIVALSNVLDKVTMGGIHPNPTSGNIAFDFFSPKNGTLEVRMIDNAGRIVLDELENIIQGHTKINFSVSNFAKGEYTIEVIFDNGDYTNQIKIVKN
jgi:fibronectin-binding autotransporter adhesin